MNELNVKIVTHQNSNGRVEMTVIPPIPLPEFIQIQMSTTLTAMEATLKDAPQDIYQDVKDDIYHLFNMAAANVLDRFDPNPTNHFATTLTEQAILKAENEIITAQAKTQAKKAQSKVAKVTKLSPQNKQ